MVMSTQISLQNLFLVRLILIVEIDPIRSFARLHEGGNYTRMTKGQMLPSIDETLGSLSLNYTTVGKVTVHVQVHVFMVVR